MYCAYCGKKIPEGALFCSYCGKPLKEYDDNKNNRQQLTDNNGLKQKNKGKRRRILIPVILVICVGLAASLFFMHFNPKDIRTIYFTSDNALHIQEGDEHTLLSVFNKGMPSYYDLERNSVVYSKDGNSIYYFDFNRGEFDDGVASLYCVDISNIGLGEEHIKKVDDYVIHNSNESSYILRPIGSGIMYISVDPVTNISVDPVTYINNLNLKFYDGEKSITLTEGDEIDVAFSSDMSTANVCVLNRYPSSKSDLSWYRIEIKENHPEIEFVCKGDSGRDGLEDDFQYMADNDMIVNLNSESSEIGYCSVELYIKGKYTQTVTESQLKRYMPTGLELNNDRLSYYTLRTINGEPLDPALKNEISLFYFDGNDYTEVSEDFRTTRERDTIKILGSINDDLIFKKDYGDDYKLVKNDDNRFTIVDCNIAPGVILKNQNGENIYYYQKKNNDLYAFYGEESKLIFENFDDANIFLSPNGEIILLAWTRDGDVYQLNATKAQFDSIDKNIRSSDTIDKYRLSVKTTEHRDEKLLKVVPYDESRFLCVMSSDDLLICDDKRATLVAGDVTKTWSTYIEYNFLNLRAYK